MIHIYRACSTVIYHLGLPPVYACADGGIEPSVNIALSHNPVLGGITAASI